MTKTKTIRHAFEVFMDAAELGIQQKIGTLYRHGTRSDLPASFEYDHDWLTRESRFVLDPRLELWRGEQFPPRDLPAFGVFQDSAPDRWGRVLMERRESFTANSECRPIRALHEMDFLLGVHDHARIGALRFCRPGGPFLDQSKNAAPPVTSLKDLAYVSQRINKEGAEALPEYEKWLAVLIAPGSSLGGARPKASFVDEDSLLWIAKFPALDDRYDVGGWELVTHRLAKRAGINVPDSRVEALTDRYHTFCVARFDRLGDSRRLFSSAMTLLDRHSDEAPASYLDLAEFISDYGATGHVDADLKELFRRVVFNVLVGNRDDHLRNHGFIREPTGWRLSPAFDINPNPHKSEHVLTLDGASTLPDTATILKTADLYRLDSREALQIVSKLRSVVSGWRDEATKLGLPRSEIARMASVIQA